MADVSVNFAIRLFSPTPQGVAIVAPIGCSRIVIQNTDSVNAAVVLSDLSQPIATGKPLPASGSETIQSIALAFGLGATVCYVSAAQGVGPIAVTFAR